MEINYFVLSFTLIPLAGFLLSLCLPAKAEKLMSGTAFFTVSLQLLSVVVFSVFWLLNGASPFGVREMVLYRSPEYEFALDFCFDKITVVYLLTGSFITFLITRYSAYYMHLGEGYKRFFNTILFFFLAYNFTVLSGNFETLFMGWEMLGISSFLLIAFYRERYLPVRNAVKVFAVYRIGDVGILLAMWASHHLWHENITFFRLNNYELVHHRLEMHSAIGLFISVCLLLAAAAKSAQVPFSSWLPRAMEGPTPSSAIFYGSLSVHFGVFLLLRTFPFWEHQGAARFLIGLTGLVTATATFFITRTQTTIKTQIAWASITQIGIMFMEVALGLKNIALIHFAGNAFLRTYQLLISPSVVSYLIRDQLYHFMPRKSSWLGGFHRSIAYSFYLFSLSEWGLDKLMNRLVFSPLKKAGRRLRFLTLKSVLYVFVPLFIGGMLLLRNTIPIPGIIRDYFPGILAFTGLLMVLRSFPERKSPVLSWTLVLMNHCWMALAVSFNERFHFSHTAWYLSGIVVSGIAGYVCLYRLAKKEPGYFDLNRYYGHVYEYPGLALAFLLSSLGLMGFPLTPSFIGEDLFFSHIHEYQYALAFFYSFGFVLSGISLIRVYARLFLGPHIKTTHETALKSS